MTMILEAPISIEEVEFTEVVTFASVKQTARCADGNGTLTPLFFSDENIDIARAKGEAVYVGDGEARWSACHVSDAALLYRLGRKADALATYRRLLP